MIIIIANFCFIILNLIFLILVLITLIILILFIENSIEMIEPPFPPNHFRSLICAEFQKIGQNKEKINEIYTK